MGMRKMLPSTQTPQAHRQTPATTTYGTLERLPSEYLIEAQGDVKEAARLANAPVSDFMRALGSDSSLPSVTQSIMFLALLDNLRIMQIASESIRGVLTHTERAVRPHRRPPTQPNAEPNAEAEGIHLVDEEEEAYDALLRESADEDEDAGEDYDPLLDEDMEPAADNDPLPDGVVFKELIRLYESTGLFIQRAASQTNGRSNTSPGRHTPPAAYSERTRVLEAVRSRPPNTQLAAAQAEDGDEDEQAMIDGLAERIVAAPEYIRKILSKAAHEAGLDTPPTEEEPTP